MTLLALDGVSRTYTMRRSLFQRPSLVQAVDGVSLRLDRGRTLGIVGESGCGKSTMARLALGLERPNGGEARFDGKPLPAARSAEWRRLRARMQLVFQDPLAALDKRLPIGAQVAEPLAIHRIGTAAERAERAAGLLGAVGMRPDQAARYPHELSGGQRQRAVLARALATNPDLLVCDEPVSALDVSIQAQVVNLLAEVQAARGIALIFISHDLRLVRQVSHEVAVMYLGRIVEQGEAGTVFAEPAHPYARALVAAVPVPGVHRPRIALVGDPPNPADRPPGCAFHPRCPLATGACRVETPELKPLPDGRLVACHVVHGDTTQLRKAA
jgi:peptide/nickel transport system ATP-binding protein